VTFLGDDAYNPSVMNTRLRWISFVCGLTVGSVFVGAETKSQNAPTPPPGYKTRLEILAAFGNGKLEIVERVLAYEINESVAITPGPPALVTMASRPPFGSFWRESSPAASNRSLL